MLFIYIEVGGGGVLLLSGRNFVRVVFCPDGVLSGWSYVLAEYFPFTACAHAFEFVHVCVCAYAYVFVCMRLCACACACLLLYVCVFLFVFLCALLNCVCALLCKRILSSR